MLRLTDPATGRLAPVEPSARGLRLAAGAHDPGTLLATDTLRRTAEVSGLRVLLGGVPAGWDALNVRPGDDPGPADLVVVRPADLGGPPYGLEHRLAWLSGSPVAVAREELVHWRSLVAAWAEEPSKPICAQVQDDTLAALSDDLATADAVAVLRGSLDLGLPPGCLFETWAWADRLLGLDLAAHVGRG
ncbi:MAG TPA: hypothetical protein VM097_07390 [Mycobacteriales bacterium]|nr:hypothetical protein [Mycobacteriales bacterium]